VQHFLCNNTYKTDSNLQDINYLRPLKYCVLRFSAKNNNGESEMTFLQHLEQLRWHLVRSAAVVVVLALIAFFNKELLFDGIILAPKSPDFITYKWMCMLSEKFHIDMCIKEISFKLQSTELSQQFTLHMMAAFIAGLIAATPYILWEIWRFISPALSAKEKRYSFGFVFFASALFLLGVLFGYFIIAPLSINFLGTYSVSNQVQNIFTLDSFISIVTLLTLAAGIVFELPIVVYFLSKIGLITPKFMRQYRKHSVLVILVVAAVITPSPDITSQMLVAIPLYFLFEISIWISAAVAPKPV